MRFIIPSATANLLPPDAEDAYWLPYSSHRNCWVVELTLNFKNDRLFVAALVAIVLISLPFWNSQISGRSAKGDEVQNIRLAYNLVNAGTFSLAKDDSLAPSAPSRYREPVPPFVIALHLKLMQWVDGPLTISSLQSGEKLEALRRSNLVWCIGIVVVAFAGLAWFTNSVLLSSLGAVLVAIVVEPDRLYTELPAQFLMLVVSLALVVMIAQGRLLAAVIAGAGLGLLVLTKGIFLYLVPPAVVALGLIAYFYRSPAVPVRRGFSLLLVVSVLTAAVVLPWSLRNHNLFGTYALTERGGVVLLIRAYKNQMTWDEYRGAIAVWANTSVAKKALRKLLGYAPNDMEKGGRLQRLNREIPEDRAAEDAGTQEVATSYYRKARAERVRMRRLLTEQGVPDPDGKADEALQQEAIRLIKNDIAAHLATTPLFLWRGGAIGFLICCAALIVLRTGDQRRDAMVFSLLGAGLVALLALTTHYIARYSYPVVPLVAILAVMLLQQILETAPLQHVRRAILSRSPRFGTAGRDI